MMGPQQIFLLSPANCSGPRGQLLLSERSQFALAQSLRSANGVSLGEVFSFISGLYFRGKLTYATAFGRPPCGLTGSLIITAARGLLPPDTTVRVADLRELAAVPIDPADPRYAEPLSRDARKIRERLDVAARVILLGSIATDKYSSILGDILGEQLLFPVAFVGRGDMSRGGLMLRCVDEGNELEYIPLSNATRRGQRPARLAPRRKPSQD
ncbi:MAG TPA: hypothetical protein VM165_21805 [Planctomycetaceae bacterium]|nr:hypothetical protein [Planctomycetaceae bacterium]